MEKNQFPALLKDNDAAYLHFVESTVKRIDGGAYIAVIRQLTAIAFHIRPSDDSFKQPILKAVLRAHTAISIRVELAKTITTSPFINFSIPTL